MAGILNLQFWIYTVDDGWITQGDQKYPFAVRLRADGTLIVALPTNTLIIPSSPYRFVIQMATKFVINETG